MLERNHQEQGVMAVTASRLSLLSD